MSMTRRGVMEAGGGFLAAFLIGPATAAAGQVVDIAMRGRPDGSHVWFDPIGIHVRPGDTIRWTNRDRGNSHTATSYHPDVLGRPLRIPAGAKPWNSDYLLPGESFSVTLTVEGVYDYYCIPHEHAGMVGRIVVGKPGAAVPADSPAKAGLTPLPEAALAAFPPVEEIMARGIVKPK